MATATAPELTDKQQDVLRLVNAGKTPTEIGKEMNISSQAVHGHFRRLREIGAMPPAETAKPAAAKRPAASRAAAATTVTALSVDSVLNAVRLEARRQRGAIDTRETEIDAQIEALKAEKKTLGEARKELDKVMPPEAA